MAIGLILLFGMALPGFTPAAAQGYPNQPIRLVVPFAAGGGVDIVARIIAAPLGERLGQSIIVENRPGAGGMLGATAVAQSAPGGYTLLLGANSTHGTIPSVQAKLTYDPVRDFVPVPLISSSPFLLLTHPALPVKSVGEPVALAKRDPGKLNFGSYGTGSINHLAGENFNLMAGIQANHLPYRGSAPALTDLVAGRLDYVFDGMSTLGYVKSGSLRLLGVAALKRSPAMPNEPTISESGIPGFDNSVWFGVFAPAGTSKVITDLLNSNLNEVLADARVKESFDKISMETAGGQPDRLAKQVESELEKWKKVAREKNIRVDP